MNNDKVAVTMPEGDGQITINLARHSLSEVLSPAAPPTERPLEQLVQAALNQPVQSEPLGQLVWPGRRVLVIVDDITRTTPTAKIAPLVLDHLLAAGCEKNDITFAVALGTHRPMTEREIAVKLGPEIPHEYPVVNTPADQADAFVNVGESLGRALIEVHRAVAEADVVVGIGSVVPHYDAGWSGGAKIIIPGMCSERTVMENHLLSAEYRENLLGRDAPPIRLDMERIVSKIGLDYVVNVVASPLGQVVDVQGGHFVAAQRAAVKSARRVFCVPFKERVDIVVSNSYPAEIDLWQACKGIWAGELMVKPGGRVILNAPCPEGVGPHPHFLARSQTAPGRLIEDAARGLIDDKTDVGDAVQIGHMLEHMQLTIVSTGLHAQDFGNGPIAHARDLQEAVDDSLRRAGPSAKVAVLTHGGYTCPVPGQ